MNEEKVIVGFEDENNIDVVLNDYTYAHNNQDRSILYISTVNGFMYIDFINWILNSNDKFILREKIKLMVDLECIHELVNYYDYRSVNTYINLKSPTPYLFIYDNDIHVVEQYNTHKPMIYKTDKEIKVHNVQPLTNINTVTFYIAGEYSLDLYIEVNNTIKRLGRDQVYIDPMDLLVDTIICIKNKYKGKKSARK